jgi:aquaporin Z
MDATTDPRRAPLLAELLGTGFLVFLGCGAAVVDELTGGAIGHGGVAAAFGLVVVVLIYTFGEVSGAHLNPAVTLAFAAAGRFGWRRVPGYVLAQTAGALGGSLLLRLLFPAARGLGATLPAGPVGQSFGLEIILTLLLMLVVLRVSTGAQEKGITAGLVVGSLVTLEALVAGPICGASMNPARSLGPALVNGQLQHLWVYLTAPVLGALLAVPLARAVQPPLAPGSEPAPMRPADADERDPARRRPVKNQVE